MESSSGNLIRRIAITGPESTGKSALAEALALEWNTLWVPEYAREYLEGLGRDYSAEDIVNIARGQLRKEEEKATLAREWLFCDTELLVTKIWSEHAFHFCDPWILEQIDNHRYDYYLLCHIDLPWEADPLREHPQLRQYFFGWFHRELTLRKLPFGIVNGVGKDRIHSAIKMINQRFPKSISGLQQF